MNLSKKNKVREEQIKNMAAIKDKESGHERQLTSWENERVIANRDEARRRRLMKPRIIENQEKAEDIRRTIREEAKEEEIDA